MRYGAYRWFMGLVILWGLAVLPALGATYTVTETSDNGTGGTVGSLSWAITQSNVSAAEDDIILFNLSSGDTLTVSATMPDITDAVTIDGINAATSNPVTIQVTTPGTSAFRIFVISHDSDLVSLSDMTLLGGDVGGSGGGTIYGFSDITLQNVTIDGSKAGTGGGIMADGIGTFTMIDSTVKNCTANIGGGLYLTAVDDVIITNSTIEGNTANDRAAAFFCQDTPATISNCTIQGNVSQGTFLYGNIVLDQVGPATFSNSTIAGNSYPNHASASGGVYIHSSTITFRNNILANNTNSGGSLDSDFNSGTFTDGGYNVVEYANTAHFNNSTSILYNTKADGTTGYSAWNQNNSDLANQNLNLAAALADNGGPNQTLALNTGSFAIDAIPYSAGTNTWNNSPMSGGNYYDQRGTEHPAGVAISIGAYSDPSLPATSVILDGPATLGKDALGGYTLTAVDDSNAPANVTEDTIFDLSSNSAGTAVFYSDAAGANAITQVTISNGSSEATFYYRDDTFGTPVITAAQSSGMSLGSANKQIAIRGNHALSFDGVDDYVQIDNTGTGVLGDNSANESFTIETWFKYDGSGGYEKIFAKHSSPVSEEYHGYTLESDGLGSLKFLYGTTVLDTWAQVQGTRTVNDGDWHHLACVYDNSGTISLYIDGILQGTSGSFTPRHAESSINLRMMTSEHWPGFTAGQLDEFRVWDDVRTQSEIRANMHRQLTGGEANLAAYYKLDMASGTTAYDATANGCDGTLTNGPAWQTSGAFAGPGNAMDFDGTDDYISLGSSSALKPASAITMECWVNADDWTPASTQVIGGNTQSGGYNLALYDDGTLGFAAYSGGDYRRANYSAAGLSGWHHVVGTFDGRYTRLYIDGVLRATDDMGSGGNTLTYDNDNSTIVGEEAGDAGTPTGQNFAGLIDELRFWNVARSATDIQDNMCRTLSGYEPGLAGYYRFDQQAVALQLMAYDQTVNNNGGLLQAGMDTTSWVASAAFNTWIGAESNAWTTAANWGASSVPGATSNIGVPDYSNATGWPVGNAPTVSGNPTINLLELATGASLTVSSDLTMNDNAILNADLSIGANTVQVDGTTLNNGTLTIGSGTFDGNGPFDASGGAVTFTDSGDLYLADTAELGTFTAGMSTVNFDGTSQAITGSQTFYNLTKTVTSAATLTFDAGSATVVQNTLTLQGAAGELLSLRSSSPGTDWDIDPQGTRTIAYLDVQDSNNVSGTTIQAGGLGCVDSGNNTDWEFNAAPVILETYTHTYVDKWGNPGVGPGEFVSLNSVAADSSGNVYTVENGNRVQKFDSSGAFIREWGGDGSGDGQFNAPRGVAVDASGNVYVADTFNSRIQKFDENGNFLDKFGSSGSGNGEFAMPYDVAVDTSGNVYVADTSNSRIQKFDSAGNYVTQWGSFGSGDGQFYAPRGIALDGSGNVYVTDLSIARVQKFDSSGTYLGQWGSSGSGEGQFNSPWGIAVSASGLVYVTDASIDRVQAFDLSGNYHSQWGSSGSGNGQISSAFGITVDASGYVYIAESGNARVQKFSPPTGVPIGASTSVTMSEDGSPTAFGLTLFASDADTDTITWSISSASSNGTADVSGTGETKAISYDPNADYAGADSFDVQVSDGNGGADTVTVNVTVENVNDAPTIDQGTSISVTMSEDGSPTPFSATLSATDPDTSDTLAWSVSSQASNGSAIVSGTGCAPTTFTYAPEADWNGSDSFEVQVGDGQATDTITVNVTVDPVNDNPLLLTSPGGYGYISQWGGSGSDVGEFNGPADVLFDSSDNMYVVESQNHRIQKFDGTNWTVFAGTGSASAADGAFNYPEYAAFDSAGNMYVSDANNDRIVKLDSSGGFVAKWNSTTTPAVTLDDPKGVAVDSSDNVYVADSKHHRIQKFNGTSWTVFAGTGTASDANGEFNTPVGLAFDGSDNLYVAERVNDRVQKFDNIGHYIEKWGTSGTGDGEFSWPVDVAIDSSGNVYVVESQNHRVQQFGAWGNFLSKWGSNGSGDGQLNWPDALEVGPSDNVYVADFFNHRVQVFGDLPAVAAGETIAVTMSEDSSPTPFDLTLYAEDTDGDTPLTWGISSQASHGTAGVTAPGTGSPMAITYTPEADYAGTDSFVVQLNDGNGGTDTVTVNVTVDPVNDAPVIDQGTSISVTMSEDGSPTAFNATLSATDPDTSDTLTWSVSSQPTHGTATVSGTGSSPTTFTYAPDADWSGSDSFEVQVGDGIATDTITVNVTVEAVNDAPRLLTSQEYDGYFSQWGANGSSDGQFNFPTGVDVDSAGNVYVADTYNDRIQKFDASGTFLAQWGTYGTGDGQFKDPYDVAVDDSGNIYVVEYSNKRVQKLDSSGAFVTKWGTSGSGDSQFNNPQAIAVDDSGNVYVADTMNHRVQKFDSSGTFLAKWGSAGVNDGEFSSPSGIAVDGSGNVYVTDSSNPCVQKFDSSGTFLAKWGASGSGNGQFGSPTGIAVDDAGNVYVAENSNHRIQKFDGVGAFLGKWGAFGTGDGEFNTPTGVAVFGSDTVYVGDTVNSRIQKFRFVTGVDAGNAVAVTMSEDGSPTVFDLTLYGNDVDGDSPLNWTISSQVSHGTADVATTGTSMVVNYTPDADYAGTDSFVVQLNDGNGGTDTVTVNVTVEPVQDAPVIDQGTSISVTMSEDGNPTAFSATLSATDPDTSDTLTWNVSSPATNGTATVSGTGSSPTTFTYAPDADWSGSESFDVQVGDGISTDTITVNVTVEAVNDAPVLLTSPTMYEYSAKWGSNGTGDGQFQNALGVAVDSASGAVYVADSSNHRIQKFDAEGNFVVAWGQQGSGDGDFQNPRGVAVDSAGNVYVADSSNNRVQKFSSNGNFLLKWGSWGTEDGRFHQSMNIAVDSSGNVYVTDLDNNRVQKFDSNGNFLLKWGSGGTGDGQFNRPYGIATAPSGDVYVVDMNNDRVQQFASDGTFIRTWGSEGAGDGQFSSPLGVTVDASGKVYVAGYHNHRVQQFSGDGVFLYKWGGYGTEDGQLWVPHDVAIDNAGKVYVMDTGNDRVQVFTYAPGVEAGASVDVTMSEDSNPTAFDLTLYANDVEGDTPLTWSITSPASHGTAGVTAPGTGTSMGITYAPDADYAGTDSFVVQLDDGNGGTDTVAVNVTVEPVQDVPVIDQGAGPLAVTMSEDGSPTAWSAPTLTVTDPDTSDTLTWDMPVTALHGNSGFTNPNNPASMTYMPDADWSGSDSFVVQVSDGNGGTDTITVNVTVEAVNDAPVIDQGTSITVTMSEDGMPTAWTSPTLTATDIELPGDTLTWSVSTAATHGTATVSGTGTSPTTFNYGPDADWSGSDNFVVQVSDGNGGTDTITVNVTVLAVNDAPVIDQGTSISVTMSENGAPTAWTSPTLTASDIEDLSLIWSVAGLPTHGTATVSGMGSAPTAFNFEPHGDWNGEDSFVVAVSDGIATDTITVIVTVEESHRVRFVTDGTEGATLTGDVEQRVADGGDCTAVTANVPAGYDFLRWDISIGGTSTDNPLTLTGVNADTTCTAVYEEQTGPVTILEYLLEQGDLTAQQHIDYDLNNSGAVTVADLVVQRLDRGRGSAPMIGGTNSRAVLLASRSKPESTRSGTLPELYIESIYWSPEEYLETQNFHLGFTYINWGRADAPESTWRIVLDGEEFGTGTVRPLNALGDPAHVWNFLGKLSPGEHTVEIYADWNGEVEEMHEDNNMTSATFNILGGPDLVVDSITVTPESTNDTGPAQCVFTVRNQGPTSATATRTRLTLDEGAFVGLFNIPALEAGESYTIPAMNLRRLAKGAHQVLVEADADEVVEESNETNNTRTLAFDTSYGGRTWTVENNAFSNQVQKADFQAKLAPHWEAAGLHGVLEYDQTLFEVTNVRLPGNPTDQTIHWHIPEAGRLCLVLVGDDPSEFDLLSANIQVQLNVKTSPAPARNQVKVVTVGLSNEDGTVDIPVTGVDGYLHFTTSTGKDWTLLR